MDSATLRTFCVAQKWLSSTLLAFQTPGTFLAGSLDVFAAYANVVQSRGSFESKTLVFVQEDDVEFFYKTFSKNGWDDSKSMIFLEIAILELVVVLHSKAQKAAILKHVPPTGTGSFSMQPGMSM